MDTMPRTIWAAKRTMITGAAISRAAVKNVATHGRDHVGDLAGRRQGEADGAERAQEAVDDEELAVAGEEEDDGDLLVELAEHRRLVGRQGVDGRWQDDAAEEVGQRAGGGDGAEQDRDDEAEGGAGEDLDDDGADERREA